MPAVPKIPGLTRMEAREAKKADAEKALRDCYAAVDARDGRVCRVSGITLTALANEPRKRLERHHMLPRSTAPSERHNPANVITVSAWIHDQLTAHRLHVEGDANLRDADGKFVGVLLSANVEGGWNPVRLV